MHLAPRQLDLFRGPARTAVPARAPPAAAAGAEYGGQGLPLPSARDVAPALESAPVARAERGPPLAGPATTGRAAGVGQGRGRPASAGSERDTARSATAASGDDGGEAAPDAEALREALAQSPGSRQQVLERARALAARIAEHLGPEVRVHLAVHDNRSTMISFRRQPPLLKIRAHHMFLDAPPPVVVAIADYAGRGRSAAGRVLDDYIAGRQARIRALPRKPGLLEARGRCFDLQAIFEAINAEFFQSGVRARIGWGRQTGKRRRKSIRLGVYDHKAREIRIHPALDRPDVPRFFVEFIVFHEMLHQLFPSDRDSGRHVHHPRAFRDRERAYPKYQAAMAWEREHLQELLRR